MNEPRYQELLGQVLDEEIGPRGLDELSEALRRDPQRLRDFQTHLVLWELFSQQRRPERNAEAFVSAWRTRLAAENDAADFLARTVDQLEPSVPESVIAGEPTAPHSAGEADESGGRWVWQMVELILAASKRRWARVGLRDVLGPDRWRRLLVVRTHSRQACVGRDPRPGTVPGTRRPAAFGPGRHAPPVR